MNENLKIFISHSSAQKKFVEEVVHELGRDLVHVDMYNFESGSDLTEEIENHIGASSVFVLFLSDEALDSIWVKTEISLVREKILDEEIAAFIPFIVDPRITHEDERLNDKKLRWIKQDLIKMEPSTKLVARAIRRKLHEAIWNQMPTIKESETLFIGRDLDMAALKKRFFENLSNEKRAIIISGLDHVGRKRLLKEFIWRNINTVHPAYDPIRIVLTETDGIVQLIQQLNEILQVYDNDTLLDKMKDVKYRLALATEFLNKIANSQERVFIRDEKCIVLGNGRLTDWFVNLLKQRALQPMIHFFIASKFTPKASTERTFPEIISRQINSLDRPSMHTLFNAYAKNRKIGPTDEDIKYFLGSLTGYPKQVYDIVDCIANSDIQTAKKQLPSIVAMFDGKLVDVIKDLEAIPHAKDILVLLSKFEFVSYDLLADVCPDDIAEAFEAFQRYSLYESFGSVNQYIRLNPAMIEYISRNKMELPQNYKIRLKKVTRELLENTDSNLTDLSSQLLAIKELLRDKNTKAKERYLLPSFVLKVIVEEYNASHDENVIELADKLLHDNQQKYDEITRSIKYWFCCALCRKKDRRFLQEVEYFKESEYSYYFLKGFYERHRRKFDEAQEYYNKALEHSARVGEREYLSKAEHELVIVKIEMGDYTGAFELAKKSYERNPMNTYHIEAYFRCMVKSSHPDRDLLKELIEKMEQSYAKGKEVIVPTMNAEYKYYINHDFQTAIDILKEILEEDSKEKKIYAKNALAEICKHNDTMQVYYKIIRKLQIK